MVETASDIDARTVRITFFPDEAAQSLLTEDLTLSQLADRITKQTAASKMELPWLKLAVFGNKRSEKNCLRTNANVVQITGIETEHDAGELSFDTAIAVMREARVRSLLYTSPSYMPATKERWRILVPLSQNYSPETRENLVARINGMFGGKIAPESFVLSQAYLFGHVDNPNHRVEVVDGDFLDLRDDLYGGSIFKDGSRVGGRADNAGMSGGDHQQHRKSRADDDPEPVDRDKIEAALNVISSDCSYEIWRNVGGALYRALGDSGFELFDRWSAKATSKYNADECRERWRGVRSLREHTVATIFYLADQADPGWRDRYDEEAQRRWYDRLRNAYSASTGGDAPGAGPSGSTGAGASGNAGTAGAATSAKPIVSATPWKLRDPKSIPRREWLYGWHLIRKFGSAKIAPPGVGKSTLALTEAIALATGRPLLGIKPRERCRVWYWNGEDPRDEIDRRIAAICIHYKIVQDEVVGWLFVDCGREQEIIIARQTKGGAVLAEPVVNALVQTIVKNKIDVVTIDPFISSHRVTENDNNAIDIVAKTWTAIADVTNCAVELVHHTRKTGGAEVTVEDGRGAGSLIAAVRSAEVLNRMTPDEAKRAGVENHREYFNRENGKANMSPPAEGKNWFRILSVNLGNGVNDEGDSVGVVTAWEWPDPLSGVTGADFERAATIIRSGRWRENAQANDWVGKAVAKALSLDLGRKQDRAKVSGLVKIWIDAGSLVVVDGSDEKRNPRKFVEVAGD